MPAACDFKFAAEHDGCPAGMVRGASGAPGLLRDASGAPCVPFRRPHAAAEPASLRVFHIAKTATTSLVKELEQCLPARVRTDEGCWSGVNRETWTANLTAPSATSVLLRHPRAHLLSMYRHCRYSGWGRWRSTSFPRNGTLVAGFGEWLAHFQELRERAPRVGRRVAKGLWWTGWGCYHPLDPQTRAMTCENRPGCAENCYLEAMPVRTWDWRENATLPPALSSLAQAQFAGVTELYDVHLCLLLHAHSPRRDLLPSGCECGGGRRRVAGRRRVRIAHEWPVGHPKRAPPARVDELPPAVLASLDALTRSDAHLYVAALRRTIALARALEARVRQRLLCRSHLEPLRAELGYLPGARKAIDEALRDAPWVHRVS